MKRLIAALAAVGIIAVGTACEPAINPPPIPPPIQWVLKQIFWHAVTVDPPNHEPVVHSCAIRVDMGDQTLHAFYRTVDTAWNANGWAFWQACVIPARDLGYSLPVQKTTGDSNSPGQTPPMFFTLVTVPIFGQGSGTYNDFNGSNPATYAKGYIEASAK